MQEVLQRERCTLLRVQEGELLEVHTRGCTLLRGKPVILS